MYILFMQLTYFANVATVIDSQIIAQTANLPITEIVIDSRSKTITPYPLFFAIVGMNHNGHDYIEDAYQQGIRQFVVGNSYDLSILQRYQDLNILQVPNTQTALQQFAAFYRSQYQLPVLGITGSNGKTTVKEWIHECLSSQYKSVSNPQSYNSQVGVPLSISLLQHFHTYAVFEAGVSTVDEMQNLATIIQPIHGLFTNIGPAHNQGFENILQKIQEKAKLFTTCNTIYYCKDHLLIDSTLQRLYGKQKKLINWSGKTTKANYFIKYHIETHTTEIQLQAFDKRHSFTVPFTDTASIENITHTVVYLLDNAFDPVQLQRSLLQLTSLPMRSTLKAGMYRCQIIDDTYTNDLMSLKLALDRMHQQPQSKRTVILSDVLQSDMADHVLYQTLANLLKEYNISRLIGIGPAMSQYAALFSMPEKSFFYTTQDFLHHKPLLFKDELILVKGARTFRLEQVVQSIQKNNHGTILEIDMHAIRHNLSYFRSKLMPTTKIMAMVKAAAYGSSFELIVALQRHGVDYLGVAYIDEGIQLRQKGISLPIMVMDPYEDRFETMIDYQLEPEIYSLALLNELCDFIVDKSIPMMPIHLKLETGMNRLGIEEKNIDPLIARIKQCPQLHIISIFSHLAAAQSDIHDAYTYLQVDKFLQMSNYIEKHLAIQPFKHILNTNGILRFPQFQFDMVRLGIGLHGVGINQSIQTPLIPAGKLKTTISHIKQVPKGAYIGYNRQCMATKDMTIATISIGYADGLSRAFGCGKGNVIIHNRHCPIIGEVCMDMSMVDVTDMNLKRGDEVIIFSAEHSIDKLAQRVGTISYELLTQISQRVKRVYYT